MIYWTDIAATARQDTKESTATKVLSNYSYESQHLYNYYNTGTSLIRIPSERRKGELGRLNENARILFINETLNERSVAITKHSQDYFHFQLW